MRVELHVLQNFAPSNLNRDDTGAPKDCDFGGFRRARISSQCQKRAVRELFRLQDLVPGDEIGARTKRLVHRVADEMAADYGMDRNQAANLALGAIRGVGLDVSKKGEGEDSWKTEYLLFIPRRSLKQLGGLLYQHRQALQALGEPESPVDDRRPEDVGALKRRSKKEAKKEAKAAYPKELREQVEALLDDARKTVDIALFGRMIADKPEWNCDASCQVAHAISTNRVQMDFDFFTAVDDFKPSDTAGSDMMGTIQFNSSCFYRYAVLDVEGLRLNLDGGDEAVALVKRAVNAFVRAFVTAVPTGKQNSMAAHNCPSYVLAVVRDGGQPLSLANAFLKPAHPHREDGDELDLVDDSIRKLERYLERVRDWLGPGRYLSATWADRELNASPDGVERVQRLENLFSLVSQRATADAGRAGEQRETDITGGSEAR